MTERTLAVDGRFLSKPQTGVTRVGRALLAALLSRARDSADLRIEIYGDRSVIAPFIADHGGPQASVRCRNGPATAAGEQLLLPFQTPAAPLLCFCNVFPLAARHPIVWLHDAHVLDTPQSYPTLYRHWHHVIFGTARLRRIPIVTISDYSKRRLVHHGAQDTQVHVILNGGDHLQGLTPDPAILARTGLAGRSFVLLMGSPAPHKNIPFAVDALLHGLGGDVAIAVGGLHQSGQYRASQSPHANARLILLPPVTDGELRALYAAASVVVVPSLFEGFGLPAAEALWELTPLVLSNRTALPEVGGKAALYFDPTRADQLVDAVKAALTPEIAARLRAAAVERKTLFSWSRAARETTALVTDIAGAQNAV